MARRGRFRGAVPRGGHTRMKRFLPVILLLVAGCAADRPEPAPVVGGAPPSPGGAAAGSRAPRAATGQPAAPRAAAVPAGPARFDGTYRGVRTTLVSGGPECTRTTAPR